MCEMQHSLLDEPLIGIRGPDAARRKVTLPGVLAGLAREEIASFEALQAHQRQAWFCFLVQLAAIALARGHQEDIPEEEAQWCSLLLALTEGDEAPWSLVVGDVSRPAFMQPPVPEGSLEAAGYEAGVLTPDELDMLVTTRNHDVKCNRIRNASPEDWLFAVVTLQTQEGYAGAGNYGIARMNSGYGNRPMVDMAATLDWGRRFRGEVGILCSARERLSDEFGYDPGGHALLWVLPWDSGASSAVPVQECDPLFIEVCRRVRFVSSDGAMVCLTANTRQARLIVPKELQGVTGDPWTPVEKAETKALTVGSSGFRYDLLRRILLSGDFTIPCAMEPTEAEADGAYLVASALVRGQGRTEGLHRRIIPVPANAIASLDDTSSRQELAERAEARVRTAAQVQRHVLYPALAALLTAGREGTVDSEQASRWTRALDAAVDDVFFPELWASLDLPRQEAARRWERLALDLAEEQLRDAIDSAPIPSIHRYRAASAAWDVFHRQAHRHLKTLYPAPEEAEHEHVVGS